MGGVKVRKGMVWAGLWLVVLLFAPAVVPRAYAEITTHYGSEPADLVQANLGESRSAPTIKYNGNNVSTGANYVWSSSDTDIASLSVNNRQVIGNDLGTALLTVTYNGESADVPVKVGRRTLFTEPPVRDGIPPILGVPGVTLGANGGQLVTHADTEPIADAPVTFYEDMGGAEICSAVTDSEGFASCVTVLLGFTEQVYVTYEGDDQYSPTARQAQE